MAVGLRENSSKFPGLVGWCLVGILGITGKTGKRFKHCSSILSCMHLAVWTTVREAFVYLLTLYFIQTHFSQLNELKSLERATPPRPKHENDYWATSFLARGLIQVFGCRKALSGGSAAAARRGGAPKPLLPLPSPTRNRAGRF